MCIRDSYCVKKVAVLNCWGKMRAWGNHMVHHGLYYRQNYSYFGVIEAVSYTHLDVYKRQRLHRAHPV